MIYNKSEICDSLAVHCEHVIDSIAKETNSGFGTGKSGKWSTGQDLQHLILSTKPLRKALQMPKLALRSMFGTSSKPSRSYTELLNKYNDLLKSGGRASGRYVPKSVKAGEKEKLIKEFQKECKRLISVVSKWSEEDMDKILLPHPLLGKITVREMLFFTVFHTEHHAVILKEKLK